MRDLGIYNNPEPRRKEKKSSGITRREFFCILATMFVVVYSALYIWNVSKSEEEQCERPVQQEHPQPVRTSVVTDDLHNPIRTISYQNGNQEETITARVVTSPYTWSYVINDLTTSDSVTVNLQLSITSQIRDGFAKLLMQNYGGNWFYTVFAERFSQEVKAYVLYEGLNFYDLTYTARQVKLENELKVLSKKIIDNLSSESLLPVDILNVRITSVEKK